MYIREWRNHSGLTCQQLADLIGKTETSVRNYEKGRTSPDEDTRKEIAKALGLSHAGELYQKPPKAS